MNVDPICFESPRDRARFVLSPAFGGIEMMHARFFDHAFTPHTHDEMMIGVMHAGVKRFARERSVHRVGRYGLSINNPGDLHTGERGGYSEIAYSSIYLPTSALEQIGLPANFAFKDAVLNDQSVWQSLLYAFGNPANPLAVEQAVTEALRLAAERYARDGRFSHQKEPPARLKPVLELMRARTADPLSLMELAALAGISPRHLIRSFKETLGLTPHRHLVGLRVQHARELLRQGEAIAEVALATGFSDQAHLTKTFKTVVGTTPASYRAVFE